MRFKTLVFIVLILSYSAVIYAQTDSLMMYTWRLDEFRNRNIADVDSSLSMFEVYQMNFENSFSNNYLTNIGQASQTNLFYLRHSDRFIFADAHEQYSLSNSKLNYYNTHRRYTNLSYYSNLSKKNNNQVLDVIHTQNINKDLNFGIEYRMISSKGNFIAQNVSNNDVSVQSSYLNHKYSYHANFIYNSIKNENNGGIDSQYVNVQNISANSEVLPSLLNNSNLILTTRAFNLLHSYDFSLEKNINDSLITDSLLENSNSHKNLKLSHQFRYDYKRLKYYHTGNDFYENFFRDTLNTFDSTFTLLLDNNIGLAFTENDSNKLFYLGAFAGAEIENNYYYGLANGDFVNSYALAIFKLHKIFNIDLYAKYFVSGRRTNDIVFDAQLSKKIMKNYKTVFSVSHSQLAPYFFENHFYSNNYAWDTSFAKKKTTTSINLKLQKNNNFEIGVNYRILDNYIYFKDTSDNALLNISPFQSTLSVNYYAVYLKKDFIFKRWIINTRFAYQHSSRNEIISVPELAGFISISYLPNIIKGTLKGGPGINVYYNSSFTADAYSPAANLFYRQESMSIGNYPYINFFLKFRLKRARLFFMFQHINFGMQEENIYAAINQPYNKMTFRFGVSWPFYD